MKIRTVLFPAPVGPMTLIVSEYTSASRIRRDLHNNTVLRADVDALCRQLLGQTSGILKDGELSNNI